MSPRNQKSISRRSLLKSTSAAAIAAALPSSLLAGPSAPPVYYGSDASKGQVPLDNTNIFPLLTAWILVTTSGGAKLIDPTVIANTANIHPDNVTSLLKLYKSGTYGNGFSTVQRAFTSLVKGFSTLTSPYTGGQCPDKAVTVAPIASLPCQ